MRSISLRKYNVYNVYRNSAPSDEYVKPHALPVHRTWQLSSAAAHKQHGSVPGQCMVELVINIDRVLRPM